MIGSGIASMFCVAFGITANAIGVGGLPGILSIKPQFMMGFAGCMAIAVAVPFLLTAIAGKRRLDTEQRDEEDRNTKQEDRNTEQENRLTAFVSGKAIPLKEVGDGVFSEGLVGNGMAIIPSGDTLYAPADAQVAALMMDSRHACGLRLTNGMEILLHIGIDTVSMNGDGFEYLVAQDEQVRAGMPLIRFDRTKIKAAGHPDTVLCIITESGEAKDIQFHTNINAEENVTPVVTFR